MGGLGNMMFQIAFVEYQAHRHGLKTGYWNVERMLSHINADTLHNPSLKHAFEYLNVFPNFSWPRMAQEPSEKVSVPFWYEDVQIRDNVNYEGFFQCEKYFPGRDFILNLFKPSKWIEREIEKYNEYLTGTTCSIHVRRGDYLKFDLHYVRDREYYQKGMDVVGEVDRYLVFSDDLEWCKQNFIGDKFIFIENEKDYVELFLQSKCTHNIISSSSFSWWGAYLNKNKDKTVVGPKQWFTVEKRNDIIPERWETI
tara:strand:- start:140 stop:901 length:762 start_codon:yes stop_codon:yes gene_type:complete